jgi:hypothetical protein
MSDTEIIEVSPKQNMRVNELKIDPDRLNEFTQLIERAYQKNPDKKDLKALREFLINYPELCRAVYSLADEVRRLFIRKMMDNKTVEVAMEEHTVHLRNEFGYHDAPVMEQLIIENIILAWLRVYWTEYQLTLFMGRQIRFAEVEFWERRLSMAQRRYLRACESLAKIRKMAIPALQLNIGDKQVNVAGNLIPPGRAK